MVGLIFIARAGYLCRHTLIGAHEIAPVPAGRHALRIAQRHVRFPCTSAALPNGSDERVGQVTCGFTSRMKQSIDSMSWPRSRLPWKLI
jgi:hypothetical protein